MASRAGATGMLLDGQPHTGGVVSLLCTRAGKIMVMSYGRNKEEEDLQSLSNRSKLTPAD